MAGEGMAGKHHCEAIGGIGYVTDHHVNDDIGPPDKRLSNEPGLWVVEDPLAVIFVGRDNTDLVYNPCLMPLPSYPPKTPL